MAGASFYFSDYWMPEWPLLGMAALQTFLVSCHTPVPNPAIIYSKFSNMHLGEHCIPAGMLPWGHRTMYVLSCDPHS